MERIDLPEPPTDGDSPVASAIAERESRRSFAGQPLSLEALATLAWAAQGHTHDRDGVAMRAAPSAGATYPLELLLDVATPAQRIEAGRYRYDPAAHAFERTGGPVHEAVTRAALNQPVVAGAPATLAVAAEYERTTSQYPEHGRRYVHMEAGHAAQNVHLVCAARGLHSCPVGALDGDALGAAFGLSENLDPLYLVPVGHPPE